MLGNIRFQQHPFEFFKQIFERLTWFDDAPAFRNNTAAKVDVNGLAAAKLDGR